MEASGFRLPGGFARFFVEGFRIEGSPTPPNSALNSAGASVIAPAKPVNRMPVPWSFLQTWARITTGET